MDNASKRILLVEDDEFLRELYHDTLLSDGYTVDTAADGAEAFKKIHEGGYDLILLDIILPKINGLDVIKKIKVDMPPLKPNKKLIFLTNLDKDEEIKTALSLGDGYLIKSQITPGDLLNNVKTYFSPSTSSEKENS